MIVKNYYPAWARYRDDKIVFMADKPVIELCKYYYGGLIKYGANDFDLYANYKAGLIEKEDFYAIMEARFEEVYTKAVEKFEKKYGYTPFKVLYNPYLIQEAVNVTIDRSNVEDLRKRAANNDWYPWIKD